MNNMVDCIYIYDLVHNIVNYHERDQEDACNYQSHPAGDVLWVFVEPGNVVP